MNTYPSNVDYQPETPQEYPSANAEQQPAAIQRALRLAVGALSGVLVLGGCASGDRESATPTDGAPHASSAATPSPETSKPSSIDVPETTPTTSPEASPRPKKATNSDIEAWRSSSRSSSYNEVVRGLDDLERRTKRRMFVGAMEFFEVPHGTAAINDALSWHPAALKQLDTADYKPTVILEPGVSLQPSNASDTEAYFAAMKSQGLTAKQWGRVVAVPELVVGEWEHNDPSNYARTVNTQLRDLRRAFPGAEGTVLIDTAPQETNAIISALKRGEKLDRSLYDTVGVQAYANGEPVTFNSDGSADISSYLSLARIKKITEATGKDRIWLNTGVTKYDEGQGKRYSLKQRIAVAEAVADVVKQAQNAGITIEDVMLFAEDKSAGDAGDEGRDFSITAGEEVIAKTLHDRLSAIGVPLTGFAIK